MPNKFTALDRLKKITACAQTIHSRFKSVTVDRNILRYPTNQQEVNYETMRYFYATCCLFEGIILTSQASLEFSISLWKNNNK